MSQCTTELVTDYNTELVTVHDKELVAFVIWSLSRCVTELVTALVKVYNTELVTVHDKKLVACVIWSLSRCVTELVKVYNTELVTVHGMALFDVAPDYTNVVRPTNPTSDLHNDVDTSTSRSSHVVLIAKGRGHIMSAISLVAAQG